MCFRKSSSMQGFWMLGIDIACTEMRRDVGSYNPPPYRKLLDSIKYRIGVCTGYLKFKRWARGLQGIFS